MRHTALFTCLALASCDSVTTQTAHDDEREVSQLAVTSVVACNPLAFTIGSLPSGQSASTLAQRELSGTQDVWANYVEFSGGSEASCTFNVGSGTAAGLSLGLNYRGPQKSEMRWTFDAYDNAAQAWVNVGDNAFAGDWTWSASSISLPAPLARFVAAGAVKIRYKAVGSADASQLDEWSLSATMESTPPPDTATYFVSTSGSDANPGTEAAPWRHINKAAQTAIPGSTVKVRGGTYNEMVTVTVSGSAAAGYTTFQSYPGETAVIDGTGVTVGSGAHDVILMENRSYLRWKGFELRNFRTAEVDNEINGISIYGASHHIEIIGNHIHDIETNVDSDSGTSAHGIVVLGTNPAAAITDVVIDSNHLHNLRTGYSEALTLNGNVTNFRITNNEVHDTNNIAIDMAGHYDVCPTEECDVVRNGLVSGNRVYNVDSACNPAYHGSFTGCGGDRSAGGIYVDGSDIVIERNNVFRANHGIDLASEHEGKATSSVTVRSNVITESTSVGIGMGGSDDGPGNADNCNITNNTLYNNGAVMWSADINIQHNTHHNTIKNNIVYGNGLGYFISSEFDDSYGNVVNNNLYFAPAGRSVRFLWNGVEYSSLSSYQTGTGNDTAGQFSDPRFVNLATPDLHLQATSPAIDHGDASVLTAGELDYDGNARNQGAAPDQGAYEHQP